MLTLGRGRKPVNDVHKVEGPSELGRVDPTEGELAVCGLKARRRGERNANLVRVDEALCERVVGNRRDTCGRVREEGACKDEYDQRCSKHGYGIRSLPHVKSTGPMLGT